MADRARRDRSPGGGRRPDRPRRRRAAAPGPLDVVAARSRRRDPELRRRHRPELVGEMESAPIGRADLARSEATAAPRDIAYEQVVEHGLRHMAWLVADDPVVAGELSDEWRDALAGYAAGAVPGAGLAATGSPPAAAARLEVRQQRRTSRRSSGPATPRRRRRAAPSRDARSRPASCRRRGQRTGSRPRSRRRGRGGGATGSRAGTAAPRS